MHSSLRLQFHHASNRWCMYTISVIVTHGKQMRPVNAASGMCEERSRYVHGHEKTRLPKTTIKNTYVNQRAAANEDALCSEGRRRCARVRSDVRAARPPPAVANVLNRRRLGVRPNFEIRTSQTSSAHFHVVQYVVNWCQQFSGMEFSSVVFILWNPFSGLTASPVIRKLRPTLQVLKWC